MDNPTFERDSAIGSSTSGSYGSDGNKLHPPQAWHQIRTPSGPVNIPPDLIALTPRPLNPALLEPDSSSDPKGGSTESKILRLNISGTPFILPLKSLLRHPKTLLGVFAAAEHDQRVQISDAYLADSGEYYFQRSPYIFETLLGFYRHSVYHVPDVVCADELLKELIYWRLQPEDIADCCKDAIPAHLWHFHKQSQIQDGAAVSAELAKLGVVEADGAGRYRRSALTRHRFRRARRMLWRMLVKPWDGVAAKIFSTIAISFIGLLVITFTIHSYPNFQHPDVPVSNISNTTNLPTVIIDYNDRVYNSKIVTILFGICALWFTFEYSLRLFAAPRRLAFLRSGMSILDLFCLVTFWLDMVLYLVAWRGPIQYKVYFMVQLFQVFQIFRIARYSTNIRILGIAISRALREIALFAVITGLIILFFGVLMYTVEGEESKTQMKDIPIAVYWAFLTVTTVGYGDVTPKSPGGRVVAVIATFAGVIILGFPISLVISKFRFVFIFDENTNG